MTDRAKGDRVDRLRQFLADETTGPAPTAPPVPPLAPGATPSPARPVGSIGRGHSARVDAGDRVGPYVIEDTLGEGGMGAVFRGRHAESGAVHAVKVLRADLLASGRARRALIRFRREAEALAATGGHPGLVRIHAVGQTERGDPWLAMELIPGRSLAERIRDDPPTVAEAAALIAEIARAVEHLHGAGFVHRDLKPGNVILGADGRARVVDLGLALDEPISESDGLGTPIEERLTRTGELLGTPAYMAPEQVLPALKGTRADEVGPATDVWALGVILYQLLTGRRPHGSVSGVQLMFAIANTRPERPGRVHPALPSDLETICLKALEPRPRNRYGSAAALADDLERWSRGDPIEARPPGVIERIARTVVPTGRSGRVAVATTAAAILVGGVLVVVALVASRRADAAREAAAAWSRFDDELDRAADLVVATGDPDAVAATAELETKLAALPPSPAADDPNRRARLELLAGLRRLSEGDLALTRTLPLDAEPWRSHRSTVVRVLVEAERAEQLGIFLGRDPTLLDDGASALLVAAAIAHGQVAPDRPLIDAVIPALGRRLAALGPAPDRRGAVRRARASVVARRLDALLGAGEASPEDDELDELLGALIDDVPLGAEPPEVQPATVQTIHALAQAASTDDAVGPERLRLRVEAALIVLLPRDARRDELLSSLQAQVLMAKVDADLIARRRGLEAALTLLGQGAWLGSSRDPADLAGDDIVARVDAALGRSPTRTAFADAIATLDHLGQDASELDGDAKGQALAALLVERWAWFQVVLERERLDADVPPWVLATIARLIQTVVHNTHDVSHAPVRGLAARVREGVGMPERLGVVETMTAGAARLHEIALQRQRALDVGWHRLDLLAGFVEFLRDTEGVDAADRIVEALRDATTIAGDATEGFYEGALARDVNTIVDMTVDVANRARSDRCDAGVDLDVCPATPPTEVLVAAIRGFDPTTGRSIALEARHLRAHGRAAEALARQERAIEIERSSFGRRGRLIDLCLERAELLLELRRPEDATAALERAFAEGRPDRSDFWWRADLWEKLGDAERAEADRAAAARAER